MPRDATLSVDERYVRVGIERNEVYAPTAIMRT